MNDPRVGDYARLLVEECLDVQPGWQVLVAGSPLARTLIDEVHRLVARKGAYVLSRISLAGTSPLYDYQWALQAPLELLGELPPLDRYVLDRIDGLIVVEAPENRRATSAFSPERYEAILRSLRPVTERQLTHDVAWVGCQYPTAALAQDAGMTTSEFADFLYGACLLDWGAERKRMQRYADRFDAAEQVRIVAPETDITLSLAGRTGEVDAGGANLPGGEFFYAPVEDSAEGMIAFSEFPAQYGGREVAGVRLRFDGGRVVEASAEREEDFLVGLLGADDGARRLGELGIGCNPRITRHLRNTLFDEKIDGTVHLALGAGIQSIGGTNVSSIHWDMVKDLRSGGRIELDGEVVQENGIWAI